MHDSTTERLTEQTRTLSESFVTAFDEARGSLGQRCINLRQQFEDLSQKFIARLDEKIENGRNLRTTLESEKHGIFDSVKKELEEIRDGFETRLKSLLAESTTKVTNLAAEAEHEISNTYKRCDDEIKHDGLTSKAQVEKSIAEFLELLAQHRNNALELIARSAGTAADTTSLPLEPAKTAPTNYDFPDDLDF